MGFAVVSAILHPDQSVDERSRGLLDLLLNGAMAAGDPAGAVGSVGPVARRASAAGSASRWAASATTG